MEEQKYLFEFIEDTQAKALTWHSAPFTGSVAFIVPKGTRAWLCTRMNITDHYFELVEGYYTDSWIESIISKAREESPIPERFNGGLSPFISIKTLLSDNVKFLPSNHDDGEEEADEHTVLGILREEYARAKQYALHEESESFKKFVQAGMCYPELSDEDRKSLLSEE